MPQSLETRLLSIARAKLADYTSSTVQNFWELCGSYARFSKLCSSHQNYAVGFLAK